jgi:hypothetical protein
MVERTAAIILREMMRDEVYAKRFLTHLKPEHFQDRVERAMCDGIQGHLRKYGRAPTPEELLIGIQPVLGGELSLEDHDEARQYLGGMADDKSVVPSRAWLSDKTVEFIRENGRHNTVLEIIEALDRKTPIAPLLKELEAADSFTLDDAPGLDLDWVPLFDYLQAPGEKFPFEVEKLQEVTCGGPSRKTVSIVIAPTNVGKSLVLCHQAAEYLRQGRHVLYITLEMADVKILKRIYANLLDTELDTLDGWTREQWAGAARGLGKLGKLKVREYASRSAHVGHFTSYLNELKQKDDFTPDVIMVDYLNECLSRTMKYGKNIGMYQYIGAISSELRAMATEHNTVIWTATQTNREGYDGEPDLKNTSESAQVNHTGDLIIGINRDTTRADRLILRILKNRDRQLKGQIFKLCVNTAKMRLYDVDDPGERQREYVAKREVIQQRKSSKPTFLKA